MSKKPPSEDKSPADSATTEKDEVTEVLARDPDPVLIGEAAAVAATEGEFETRAAAEVLSDSPADTDPNRIPTDVAAKPAVVATVGSSPSKARFPWFGLFNFLLILVLAGAAGFYWREQQQHAAVYQANYQADLVDLQRQLRLQFLRLPIWQLQ
jgi:hypothetical protein